MCWLRRGIPVIGDGIYPGAALASVLPCRGLNVVGIGVILELGHAECIKVDIAGLLRVAARAGLASRWVVGHPGLAAVYLLSGGELKPDVRAVDFEASIIVRYDIPFVASGVDRIDSDIGAIEFAAGAQVAEVAIGGPEFGSVLGGCEVFVQDVAIAVVALL